MNASPTIHATSNQPTSQMLALSGAWTGHGIGAVMPQLDELPGSVQARKLVDFEAIEALDTAVAWILLNLLARFQAEGATVEMRGLRPEFGNLFAAVGQHLANPAETSAPTFCDHGRMADRLQAGLPEAQSLSGKLADLGIDMDEISESLQVDGVRLFDVAYRVILSRLQAVAMAEGRWSQPASPTDRRNLEQIAAMRVSARIGAPEPIKIRT